MNEVEQAYTGENIARTRVLRRLIGYMKPHSKRLLGAFVVLMLATGADVMGPILIKTFIDDYLTPRI